MKNQKVVIAILGYANDAQGNLLAMTRQRLRTGLAVYQQYPEATVIVSGGFGSNFNTTSRPHAEYQAEYLQQHQVPAGQIVTFPDTRHTVAEAVAIAEYLHDKPCTTLYLVTSAVHMPRAKLIFKHFFTEPPLATVTASDQGVDPIKLAQHAAEEKQKIALIRSQGGLLVNGELITIAVK